MLGEVGGGGCADCGCADGRVVCGVWLKLLEGVLVLLGSGWEGYDLRLTGCGWGRCAVP